MIQDLANWVRSTAEGLGGPGLVLVAFFDSSFLTLPEVADLLIVVMTIQRPDDWWYFSALTTLGSIAGSYTLYLVGRKGGEALLRRRFHARHVDRGLAWYRRFGALVLIIPAMLPPPMPFKVFVLAAGVSGVARWHFVAAVAVGRGIRYGGFALLARWYGERAADYLHANLPDTILPALGGLAVVLLVWWLWRRRRGASSAPRVGGAST